MEEGATVHSRSDAIAAALAGELNVVFGPVQLAIRPSSQIPDQSRLDALEVVRSWIRRVIDVGQVVSASFGEIHRYTILQPRDVAHRRTLHPTHEAHVRRIVDEAVIRDQLVDKRRRRY